MTKARPCHRSDLDARRFERGLRIGHRLERDDIVLLAMHKEHRRFAGNLAEQVSGPRQSPGKGGDTSDPLLPMQASVERGRSALREADERQAGIVESAPRQQFIEKTIENRAASRNPASSFSGARSAKLNHCRPSGA